MKNSFSTVFHDLLFNSLMVFVCLFVVVLISINIQKQDNNTETKAEFIITVDWPTESDDDVDSYLQDPLGNIVYFRRREDGLMHLDRDDLGKRNDVIRTSQGVIKYDINREIITVRGIVPGEYIFNVHMYLMEGDEHTIPVDVNINKLNPFSTIFTGTVDLKFNGHEKTVCRFTVEENGNVKNINYLEKLLTQ